MNNFLVFNNVSPPLCQPCNFHCKQKNVMVFSRNDQEQNAVYLICTFPFKQDKENAVDHFYYCNCNIHVPFHCQHESKWVSVLVFVYIGNLTLLLRKWYSRGESTIGLFPKFQLVTLFIILSTSTSAILYKICPS